MQLGETFVNCDGSMWFRIDSELLRFPSVFNTAAVPRKRDFRHSLFSSVIATKAAHT